MPVEDAPRNRSSGTWRVQHRRPMQPALWRQCTLAVPTASAPELSRRVHRRDRRVQVLGSNCGNGLPRPWLRLQAWPFPQHLEKAFVAPQHPAHRKVAPAPWRLRGSAAL